MILKGEEMRFEDVTESVEVIVNRVRERDFSGLVNCEIKVLFDLKRRMSGGKLILGRMQKTNEITRHLTTGQSFSGDGYDYILYLDKMAWTNMVDGDKVRLIRHELRHCFYDINATGNPYKLIGHSIEDFYEEIELNADEPRWAQRVVELTMHMYEQERERNE
jgi:hypothetical protein